MKDKRIKKDLNNLTDQLIKSDFSAIQRKLDNNEGVILRMENEKKKTKRNIIPLIVGPTLAVASLILVLTMTSTNPIVTTITIDVNPSVEMGIDANGNVQTIEAINQDGTSIIEDIKVTGETIETATEKVVNELVNDNYLTQDKNSVLVTGNGENANQIVEQVNNTVQKELTNNNIESSVITQVVEKTQTNEELANKYNISLGKVELINKIVENNSLYNFETLVELTTNDLNLLLESSKNQLTNITKEGKASTNNYLSEEEVLAIALQNANVTEYHDLEVEFDLENSIMVYEVEFNTINGDYEYDINAITGEIIKTDIDINESQNNNNSNSNNNDNDDDDDDDNDDDDDDDDDDSDDDDDDRDND